MTRRFCLIVCCLLASSRFVCASGEEPIRVLIIDGRNNHAWEGTTTSVRQTLLQTGACEVDVSTSPIRYPKPYPTRLSSPTAQQQAEYDAAVAVWRSVEKKYEASIADAWDNWRPAFSDYDVVVDNYNGPNWPPAVKKDFVDFVRSGGGVIVLHAANNCFPDWDEFNQMLGLGWRKSHQGIRVAIDPTTGQPVTQPVGDGPNSGHGSRHPFVVTTRAVEHPIMKGLPVEWLHGKDELYHAMREPAEGVEILATAFSDEKLRGTNLHEPVVWTTQFGKGRVVTSTMGHYWWTGGEGPTMRHSLHCVGFQTLLARSCQWAAGRDVTIDVPVEFPSPDVVSIVHPEDMHWTAAGKTLPLAPQAVADVAQRVKMKKARNPYSLLTPAESMESIQLPDGYRLELVLSEPVIREPVLAAWDGNGRMFVAEMRSYMQDEYGTGTKTLKNGRISRHEDTTGDGKLDRHTVFLDNLNLPRMMLPLDDRLAVVETDSTDIHTYRDTDGDGVADEKKLIYEGSRKIDASRSVEHQDSGLFWAIDNWIYLSRGRERYRFVDGEFEVDSIEFDWNQWGLDQDDTGRLYFNANSEPVKSFQQHPIYWTQIASKANGRWRKPEIGSDYNPDFLTMHSTCDFGDRGEKHSYESFTSATGGSVYRGDVFPQDVRGDYFICDPTGHVVRRAKVERCDGKITFANAYEAEKSEFIVSDDINSRPVSTHSGPDGCLYVVDMYRGMIQDAPWVNDAAKAFMRRTGLNFNIQHGRVYRVVHEARQPSTPLKLLEMPTAELAEQLASDNGWVRDMAQKLILLRDDRSSITPALIEKLRSHRNPLARLHALWTLDGLGQADAELLVSAFEDSDWRVREAAIRISEPLIAKEDSSIWNALPELTADDDPNVARQLILSLGWKLTPAAIELIDLTIEKHITNEVVYLSAMTALFDTQTPMIKRMLNGVAFRTIKDPSVRINTQRRWNLGIANWKRQSAPVRPLDAEAVKLVENGYQIYSQLCINCHGQDGKGVQLPGQHPKAPPLAGSLRVIGQKEVLGRIILHGLTGPVDGKDYREVMAPSDKNDDEWIASVMSYVRQEWGNLASVIRPDDVAGIRSASAGRYRAWSLDELSRFNLPELTNRSTWKVDTNGGPEVAARAINGKSDSCDNSNEPGRWFQVDLTEAHTVTSLVLTSSTPDRYPREYQILSSPDGRTWSQPVATGKGEGAINVISFEPTFGRFFRIVQTGSDSHHRWSISDLKIQGVPGEPAVSEPDADEGPLPPVEELVKLPGEAASGRSVFRKICVQCHQVDGTGTNFGPDLSKVATRLNRLQILQSILNPDAVVDKKYHGEMIVTSDGQVLSGFIVAAADDVVTLQTATKGIVEVFTDDIEVRKPLTRSFMPSGLERTMSKQHLLDLVEYLMQRK